MTADNEPDEDVEPEMHLGFQTPFGIVHDPDDLPPEARAALIESFHRGGMPDDVRAALGKALRIPRHAAIGTETSETHSAGDTPGPGGFEPFNTAEEHRQVVWGILDTAFRDEPHLWRAGEALFTLSAENPTVVDEAAQRAALEDATQHLQHHAARLAPALSPEDQMVEDFRRQLGGM